MKKSALASILGSIAVAVVLALPRPLEADDLQLWQWATIDLLESDDWRFYLYADNRFDDDLSEAYLQVLSPRFKWHAHENLDLGFGYAWLNIDPLSDQDRFWQHRAEFEFNPKVSTGHWSFHCRNRLELRWNNGRGQRRPRARHRLQITRGLRKGSEDQLFKHFYANNEFFFDLSGGQFVENRLVPFGVGLRLGESTSLNAFYMIRSTDGSSGWEHAHVAGTFFQIGF